MPGTLTMMTETMDYKQQLKRVNSVQCGHMFTDALI